ncbi:MASE1 domain-containing protein [[Phormidium] sp. ETS-05]|uniref:MASE1 domain-containing protein n=1 Tax=[Phormidium] sp. ETS-05 TaxID=222819 RepID=UPI0018EEF9B8|nr:MASE1 domain-containing protein [[Phormidium] sp. ETS-05]
MQSKIARLKLRQNLTLIVGIAFFYCALGVLGLKLAVLPGDVTAVWVPAGLGLGAVLLWGKRIWPGIALGSFGISVVVNPSPISLTIGAVTAVGNTLTPLFGAFFIHRFTHSRYPFHRASEVFQFVAWGAMGGQIISATVGIGALCVGQWVPWSAFGAAWITWWVSNVAGVLIFTPVLLTWHRFFRTALKKSSFWSLVRQEFYPFHLESLTWFLLFDVVVSLAFWYAHPVEYLTIPLLVWVAFRFPARWTTLAIALTGSMAIAGTILNRSSFVGDNLNASLLFLESFIAVISVTTLVLMAVLQERSQALEGLKQAKAELESRVIERTRELSEANAQLQRQELHLREKAESLAQTLRQLKQTQAQLIQNEKMTSLGQLVAGIAHEINNPVSFIYSNLKPAKDYFGDLIELVELYQDSYPDPDDEIVDFAEEIDLDFMKKDCLKLLESMQSGADRIQRIVLSLRNFSRLDEANLKSVDIHDGIESTLLILQHRLDGFSENAPTNAKTNPPIEIIKKYSKLPLIECYAGEINQVYMNILTNAIDAIADCQPAKPGRIIIETTLLESEQVMIAITDNGGA